MGLSEPTGIHTRLHSGHVQYRPRSRPIRSRAGNWHTCSDGGGTGLRTIAGTESAIRLGILTGPISHVRVAIIREQTGEMLLPNAEHATGTEVGTPPAESLERVVSLRPSDD
jgi:hypothetical protein